MSAQRIADVGIGAFLRARPDANLPDGRPLHQYDADDEEFAALRAHIAAWRREGFQWTPRVSAALVLLLSEWSFREATRLHGFWEDAQAQLELPFDDMPRYQYLADGFRYWGRRVPDLARRRWITALVREGGFPLKLSTTGFDGLIDDLLRRFSWEWLAGSRADGTSPASRVAQYLFESGRRQLAILDSWETAEFLADLVTSLARYRAELDRCDYLPKAGEEAGTWLARVPPGLQPGRYLPVRTRAQLDGFFGKLLFPRLERSTARSPLSVAVRWPAGDTEPLVIVKVPPSGLAAEWVTGFFPDAVRASRITIAPSETLRLSFDLDRDGAAFVTREPATWPLWPTAGRDVCVVRRTLHGAASEFDTGVNVPDPGPVAVFGPDGALVEGRMLRSGTRYRLWFAEVPEDLGGPATLIAPCAAEAEGAAGDRVQVAVRGEELSFLFAERPLEFALRGPRWRSGDRVGPYIGPPTVCVHAPGDVFARVNGPPDQRLRGGPVEYRLPDALDHAGHVRLSLRAGPATGQASFWMLPFDTRFGWGPLERGGGRRLTVSSRGLTQVRVLDESGRELEPAVGSHVIDLVLPPSQDDRLYTLELCYPGGVAIKAPLADVRRRFAISLGSENIPLRGSSDPVRLERATARLAALTGTGHPAKQSIAISVRSVNRGRRLNKQRQLPLVQTDEDGDLRLALDGLVDELENSARHEITLEALDDRMRWALVIDDSHFDAEPEEGEPYGACLPGCALRGVPVWKWVPAARQWEAPCEAPMQGSAEAGWWPPPIPPTAGGVLAAPFDGSVRLAYVRYVPGPPVADEEETLVRALADREGLTSRLLRQEFARDAKSRQRLIESLRNLAFFEAGESLLMTRLARIDGAPLAYAAVRSAGQEVAEPGDLRALPLGAWLRVAQALLDDTGEWASHLFSLSVEVTELPIIICALHHAGLPVPGAQLREIDAMSMTAAKLPATRLRRTTAGNEMIAPKMSLFDVEKMLAVVLTQWLRADQQAFKVGSLDDELLELGRVPVVLENLLRSGFPESLHLFQAPLLLAGCAAQVVLDGSLSIAVRSRLRRLLLAPRQQRAWTLFEPVASGLYLVALSKLWQDFRRTFPAKEAALGAARTIEVEEVR